MTLDLEKYTWTDGQTDLSAAELNARFYAIIRRLHALEQLSIDWTAAISSVQNYGLARINDAVQPLIDGLKVDLTNLIAQGKVDLASQSAAVDAALADVDTRMAAVEATITAATASVTAHAARLDNPHQVTAAQSNAIALSLGVAKGDLIAYSADATPARLGIGAEGQVPRVSSAATTGIAWGDAPNPNSIISGNFDYWFEATSQTSSGYGSDTTSRNEHVGSSKTHLQGVFAPGDTDAFDAPAQYYSRTVVTSVAGAGNYVRKTWRLENVRNYVGLKTFSFQGRVPSGAANVAVEFRQYFGAGGSAGVTGIGSQLVACATGWAKQCITVTLPSVVGKTIGSGGDDYLEIVIWFDAGSSFASRTANLGQQSGTFDIAQVKFEHGEVATPFVTPDQQHELSRIYRYFYSTSGVGWKGIVYTTTQVTRLGSIHPVEMRVSPTITMDSSSLFDGAVIVAGMELAGNFGSKASVDLDITVPNGLTVGRSVTVLSGLFKLDARL